MFISLHWLKDFVNIPDSIDPLYLKEKLTTSTAEIEGYNVIGQDKIIVGKVIKIEKHPNADKLRLVTVDLKNKQQKVVCGGTNLKEGMLIAFALEGAKVKWHGEGEYVPLEKATIRGVESSGMICASNEIDLPIPCGDKEITDLSSHVTDKGIGKNVFDVLGIRDVVLEVDNKSLTNRPDLFGHYGFAREAYAVLRNQDKMKMKISPYPQKKLTYGKEKLNIEVDSQNCRRYSAVKLSNVKVESSPLWLQQRLQKVGVRPINNIVDITNYVMYELGQPLHAFDACAIEGNKIIVRQAKKGERLAALDTKTYELSEQDLVIADRGKPVAIAGIMGGEHFSITEQTTDVIFESANFDPTAVRKTSQRLSLRSESSTRFEKNLDPEYTLLGLNRAVSLLVSICPSAMIVSTLFDTYTVKIKTPIIPLRPERITHKIGLSIPLATVKTILKDLGCILLSSTTKKIIVQIPSWRATKDITIEDDLIEEVARIYGYHKISLTPPTGILVPSVNPEKHFEHRVRMFFTYRLGFSEVLNYPFTNRVIEEKFGFPGTSALQVKNPVSTEYTHLKTSLVADLLHDCIDNIHRHDSFSFFEMGRVYQDTGKDITEQKKIGGIVVTPNTTKENSSAYLFFTVKQQLESLFSLLGMQQRTYTLSPLLPFLEPGQAALITINNENIGWLGHVKTEYKNEYDLTSSDVVLFELDQQQLEKHQKGMTTYTPIPKFPPVLRDLAFVVDKETPSSLVEQSIQQAHPYITNVTLFDIYEGEKIGNDKRSLTYAVAYQHPEKTLTEQEISEITNAIIKAVEIIGGTLRSI